MAPHLIVYFPLRYCPKHYSLLSSLLPSDPPMESLSISLLSSLPLRNHPKTPKFSPKSPLPNCIFPFPYNAIQFKSNNARKISAVLHSKAQFHRSKKFQQVFTSSHLSFLSLGFSFPLSTLAAETTVVPTEEFPSKINLEAIVVSIDEFFNKYPFFVAGVTFIWLVVIPLAEEYFQKYKFISAVDAFGKLRDDPTSKLLDVRDKKSLAYFPSPNLRMLNKSVVQVEFREGEEDAFVKRVFENFLEPENTTVCILDNFDGNSMKVAELLVKNGLKEAYAIRGGIRGNKGWQEIQETLLPPSVHVYPKKKVKEMLQQSNNMGVIQTNENNSQSPAGMTQVEQISNGSVKKSINSISDTKSVPRSSSPYPNYPDLKPPSSPTPSKPQS